MRSNIIQTLLFACFGISAEIIFTGLKYNVVLPIINGEDINWVLEGNSYVWMLFIYGSIPFLFPLIYNKIKKMPGLIRSIVYSLIIFSIEYISGLLLDITTGNCPWLYTEGITLNGYIRLDYLPLWMIFGWLIEKCWLYIQKTI